MLSPLGTPPSPADMLMPLTLRITSLRLVAPLSSIMLAGTTVTLCGKSSKGDVYFGDDNPSALYPVSLARVASTVTEGNTGAFLGSAAFASVNTALLKITEATNSLEQLRVVVPVSNDLRLLFIFTPFDW